MGRAYRWTAVFFVLAALRPTAAAGATLSAEISAVLQENPSVAAVRVDFERLMAAAGAGGAFRPDSVEVRVPGGGPVPARVIAEPGIYRVLWQVPAGGATAGEPSLFELKFGSEPGRSPALEHPENLVHNGDFTLLDEARVPLGVVPGVTRQFVSGDLKVVEDGQGGNAVSFRGDPDRRPTLLTPWIRIRGGAAYRFRVSYRIRGARAHHYNLVLLSWINYRDAEGATIPRVRGLSTREEDSGGWQEYAVTLNAPAEAAEVNFSFHNCSIESWAVEIGEISIVPANTPEIGAAVLSGGERVGLAAESESVHRFDLGPDGSAVMDGFSALSPGTRYDAERGYGFTRLARIEARDKLRPDTLARDFIAAARADFRLDLPDGEYRLWLLSGDSQATGTVTTFYFDRSLRINGREVFRDDTSPAEYFRNDYYRNAGHFWLPGMDYHETFVAPRFEAMDFPVTVDRGRLDLDWRNMPVCAFIVYPAALAGEVAAELESLAGRRRREGRVNILPGPEEESVEATAGESGRGFILFRRPANEEIFPSSRPREGERLERLAAFGVPGQAVADHFSLYPLKDLGPVSVRTGGLSGPGGRIEPSAAEIRVSRYVFRRAEPGNFRVSPLLLDLRDEVPVTGGTTWSWYVILRIPPGTPPGEYRGEVEIVDAGSRLVRAAIPLEVTVLPFELEPLPIVQGYYYFPSEPWYSTFWGGNVVGPRFRDDPEIMALIEEQERRELRFMKSLGLNSASFSDDMRGDLELVDGEARLTENNRFAWWMDIYTEEGMGPMPFYGFSAIGTSTGPASRIAWLDRDNPALAEHLSDEWTRAYLGLVRDGARHQEARGWPEILWYISDERSNYREEGARQGQALARLLREVPEARSIASMNGPFEHIMVPELDISMPNIAFPITGETVEMIREHDSRLWLYNCGDQRLTLGLYPWRVEAGGRFQWHYRQLGGEQWDDGTGRGSTRYSISFSTPDGVVPGLASQVVREAIYDHRYIVTLEKAMADARASLAVSADAALADALSRAGEFVDYLRSRVPVDIREVIGFRVDPRAASAAIGGEFRNTDNLDRVRWAMARLIMELRGSM